MPLMFSECDKQLGLFQSSKSNSTSENSIKNYDSCLVKTDPGVEAELIFPDIKSNKAEELSLEDTSQIYISEDFEEESVIETAALRHTSGGLKSSSNNAVMTDNYLTMPGTIKRGKKKGQNVKVILNMSREELEILEANIATKKGFVCSTESGVGFHVLLWTILCFPFCILISGIYSFCIGTITWYNVFKFFSENKAIGYKILFPPVLIILYPFLIVPISLGLGLYAGIKQLSCCWDSWWKEFTDYEKGFFGWLCNSLDIPECCPYEVVILSGIQKP